MPFCASVSSQNRKRPGLRVVLSLPGFGAPARGGVLEQLCAEGGSQRRCSNSQPARQASIPTHLGQPKGLCKHIRRLARGLALAVSHEPSDGGRLLVGLDRSGRAAICQRRGPKW